jgi:hypothetical protein
MRKKRSVWLITCYLLAHTPQPYLYNSTLISLQLFKLTPISLQLDLWLIWILSYDLYLFGLLTWSYSNSNSTWSPPQLGFQLNWIPHPWTLQMWFSIQNKDKGETTEMSWIRIQTSPSQWLITNQTKLLTTWFLNSCIAHSNWCSVCAPWTCPLGVPLPLLLYSRGRGYKEGNRVVYDMIPIRTLSLLTFFTDIFIDIIIYVLGSTSWSSGIFWMVGWVIADPSLGLPSLYGVVPGVPILVNDKSVCQITSVVEEDDRTNDNRMDGMLDVIWL